METPTKTRIHPPTYRQQDVALPSAEIGRPLAAAAATTVVSLLLIGLPRAIALQADWSREATEMVDGAGRFAIGLALLLWLRRSSRGLLAGATAGWRPQGLRRSWVLGIAALMPLYGLFFTEWPLSRIGSWMIFLLGTVLYETVMFRGVIFSGLAGAWASQEHGVRNAAIASSILFGLAHIHPVAVVGATAVALAFTRLQIDTRSLYPAMVVHFVYDLATLFPLDAAGETTESRGALGMLLSGPVLLVACGLALVALHHQRRPLAELMTKKS